MGQKLSSMKKLMAENADLNKQIANNKSEAKLLQNQSEIDLKSDKRLKITSLSEHSNNPSLTMWSAGTALTLLASVLDKTVVVSKPSANGGVESREVKVDDLLRGSTFTMETKHWTKLRSDRKNEATKSSVAKSATSSPITLVDDESNNDLRDVFFTVLVHLPSASLAGTDGEESSCGEGLNKIFIGAATSTNGENMQPARWVVVMGPVA